MAYPIEKIRNICLLGHGGDGKTSLVESLLYRTGGTDRLGKIAEGNTVSDYDPEEIKRQISIQASLAPVEYEDHILNFIDTPGFFDFDGEVAQALRVADCGVIVVAAKSGCAVGTEKAWKRLSKTGLPRFFYISKIDEENADYEKAYQSLRDAFGISVTPFVIPLMEGGKPTGVINLINRKAFKAEGKVIVEKINMVSKHMKPRRMGETGGMVKAEGAMYACKVMPVCPKCGKATRVGHTVKEGKNVRICKKCGAEL